MRRRIVVFNFSVSEIRALLCALALGPFVPVFASDSYPFEMEEVLVTGIRDDTLWNSPRSAAVITAEDIARATTSNLVDLLAQEANVNLRSFFGTDKFSGVDIRGMGDTFSSNVLVLVDGVRLNDVDLSGADFSSVSLDQVERIEVIRGANAVRYGNGAVGGVINIRTRQDGDEPSLNARLSSGSFDTHTGAVDMSAGAHGLNIQANAAYHDTQGFRENGEFNKRDGSVTLRYGRDWFDAHVRAAVHADRYGIPGPLPLDVLKRSEKARRATRSPNDEGKTFDRRYRAGLDLDLGNFGNIRALARHRNRTNPFIIGYTPLLPESEQLSTIESVTRNYEATWTLPYPLFGAEHELVFGYEHMNADYERRESGRGLLDRSSARVGRVAQHGGFMSSRWSLPANTSIELGYRQDRFSVDRREEALREICDTELVDTPVMTQVETIVNTIVMVEVAPGVTVPVEVPISVIIPITINVALPVETNCRGELFVERGQGDHWRNEAWEAGLNWQPRQWFSAYVSYHRSFRNPNVDELSLASDTLGPQDGEHWEFGMRVRESARFEAALSLFQMTVEDEIFFGFDATTGLNVNFNLERGTRRRGIEVELKGRIRPQLRGWINASYLDARLRKTTAPSSFEIRNKTDTFIPLVPRDKLAAGLEWEPATGFTVASTVTYSGTRFDGNDFDNNQYDKLDAYHLVDAKVRWQGKGFAVAAAVNNLTNEIFATAGYSGTVYPMPSRSLMFELTLQL